MKKFGLIFLTVVVSTMAFIWFSDKKVKNVEKKDEIDLLLDSMSIEEKIAQMLVINVDQDGLTDEYLEFFRKIKPGGVILMSYNFTTYEETKNLIEVLKKESNIPLIVSTDQEGGRVQRLQSLSDDVTFIPDMLSVGNVNDESIAFQIGRILALEVKTLGINVINAPVVDVFSNVNNKVIGDRSFSSDVSVVSQMAKSLANGIESEGVIATYKHFPGHGDTETDSHLKLPVIYKNYNELKNLELVPYKDIIDNNAKLIMTGHISLPLITGDNSPASLSYELITEVLKNKLGYDGLVITDALNMKALTDNYSNEEIYVKAVLAGCDLLLMPVDVDLAILSIKNNISEERINESVKKILEFKYKYLNKDISIDKSYLKREEYEEVISKLNFER